MYCLTDEQVDYILNDIRRNGIEMEDLQLNLLDHVCCIVEQNLEDDGDFEGFYRETIQQFYKTELREIETETIFLLTFKNYYQMKKAMIWSGTFSVATFLFGSFLKIGHWHGASLMLFAGIVSFSFLFLPLLLLIKTREAGNQRDKIVLSIGIVASILYSLATLFTLNHWNGGSTLWFTAAAVSVFIFIPVYFFTGIRRQETKINTILTSILLVAASCLQFALMRVHPDDTQNRVKMYSYLQNEKLLKNMQYNLENNLAINETAADINTTCEQIKSIVLKKAIGQPSLPATVDNKFIIRDNEVGGEFSVDEQGGKLLANLRAAVNKYNISQPAEKNRITVDNSILSVDGNIMRYCSNLILLSNITQVQLQLASVGNAVVVMK